MHLIIGFRVWTFLRLRIRRIGFVAIGFLFVTYANGEIEKLLDLSNNSDGLFALIIVKNLAYVFLIGVFSSGHYGDNQKRFKNNLNQST